MASKDSSDQNQQLYKIQGKKEENGIVSYLVKWAKHKDPTWEIFTGEERTWISDISKINKFEV